MPTRATLFLGPALALTLVLAAFAGPSAADAAIPEGQVTIIRSIPAPNPSPDGITWDGTHLLVTECTSEIIYKVDPLNGEVFSSTKVKGAVTDHLDLDGDRLWGNDHHEKSAIHEIDPETLTIRRTLDLPWKGVMGVAFDGKWLWTMDPGARKVHAVDPETGLVVRTLPSPGGNTCGIGFDGKCLWVGDLTARRYYQIDREKGQIHMSFEIPGPPSKLPTGFAFVGPRAWIVDEDPENPTLFLVDLPMPTEGPCAPGTTVEAPPDAAPDAGTYADLPAEDQGAQPSSDPGVGSDEAAAPSEDSGAIGGADAVAADTSSPVEESAGGGGGGGCSTGAGSGPLGGFAAIAFVALLLLRSRSRRRILA